MAAGSIGWVAKFRVRPENRDAFRKIAEGAVRAVQQAEPRIVVYEWLLSPDQARCEVHLWFADQDAALAHLQGVAPREYLPRALQVADFEGVELHGTPGPELAKALEGFPVKARNASLTGFTRPAR